MSDLLMPKATAVWLIDNTALTFTQIAEFCSLHDLEVRPLLMVMSAWAFKAITPS